MRGAGEKAELNILFLGGEELAGNGSFITGLQGN